MDNYQQEFLDRTRRHIDRVNDFALKIDKRFPMHDCDKIDELFDDYSLMNKRASLEDASYGGTSNGLTEEETDRLSKATLTHITTSEHHPEYWAQEKLEQFDRFNPPQGLHCELMPEHALDEMCADWCAMSKEFDNSPFEWLDKTVPSRWIFTPTQVNYIKNTLSKMWNE